MKEKELINYIYENFVKTENDWKELRKRMIFARAHLCSSVLLSWIQKNRREILLAKYGNENYYKKARELVTGHPDSIDNYLVKNLGWGSMYDIGKRMKLTDQQYEDLLVRSQKIEKFIKEDLEKGTEWEGEFDKRFPDLVKHEEESWENYEIRKKILNKEE